VRSGILVLGSEIVAPRSVVVTDDLTKVFTPQSDKEIARSSATAAADAVNAAGAKTLEGACAGKAPPSPTSAKSGEQMEFVRLEPEEDVTSVETACRLF
jgi:hypothetical protein